MIMDDDMPSKDELVKKRENLLVHDEDVWLGKHHRGKSQGFGHPSLYCSFLGYIHIRTLLDYKLSFKHYYFPCYLLYIALTFPLENLFFKQMNLL